jgi:hypothetical protein
MNQPEKRPEVAPLLTLPKEVLNLVLTAAYGNSAIARLPALQTRRGVYKAQSLCGTSVRLWHGCRPEEWLRSRKSITDVLISEHRCGEGISATLDAIRGAAIRKLEIYSVLDTEVATRGIWHYLKDFPLTHLSMSCTVHLGSGSKLTCVSLEGIRDALPGPVSYTHLTLPTM